MAQSFELYDAALSSLYEAPTDPSSWIEFISRFGKLIKARGGQYHAWDTHASKMAFAATTDEYPEKDTAYYNTYLAPTDPRRQLTERAAPGEWVFDNEHFDARFVDRSEVYRWLHPWDIRYAAAVRLSEEPGVIGALGLFRAEQQEPFGETEKCWLNRITPHIQRASKLFLRMESLRDAANAGLQASNALEYPILVVDEGAHIRFANLAAEALLRAPHAPLKAMHGKLRGATATAQASLAAAVHNATSGEFPTGNVITVQRDRGTPQYQVVVLPAGSSSAFSSKEDRPMAVITLGTPARGHSVDAEFLRQLFGLSDAESRIVAGLAQGQTLKQLAEQASVSINTVRTQLQMAFEKTNTHRQAELVNLLAALPRLRR